MPCLLLGEDVAGALLVTGEAVRRVVRRVLRRACGRSVPRAVPGNEGRTPSVIAAHIRRDPSTVRRHLHKLQEAGLAYQRHGLWWRYSFDPDAVVAEHGIDDKVSEKRIKHAAERYSQAEQLIDLADEENQPIAVQAIEGGLGYIVMVKPGEVLWSGSTSLHWPLESHEETG